MGTGVKAKDLVGFLLWEGVVPRVEGSFGGVDRAGDRSCHEGAFAGEEVHGEFGEGSLWQVFEVDGHPAGVFFGFE